MIIPSTDISPQHCPLAFHRHLMLNMAKLEFPICLKSTPALSHPVVPPFTWPSRILGIHICSAAAAAAAAAAAKSLQSCPTLCDPMDGSPPGSTIPGILQARTLEWVAISFSNA